MAEEKKDVFDEFEELKKEIRQETSQELEDFEEDKTSSTPESGGDSVQNDETSSSEDDSNSAESDSPIPRPSPRIMDGESHAYDDLDINQMGKPQQKTSEKAKDHNWPKPPERKKPSKGGGKDIMELIWNEFIMGFYDWVIDTAVDTVLDFTDWVLYKPYNEDKNEKPEEPKEKTAFDYGDELIAKYSENAKKGKELFTQAHNEIIGNINRSQAGMAPEWKVWKNEPTFFSTVLDLAKKADENPNSPEAEKYARFIKAPELLDSIFKKEILLRKMSIGLSAIDETLNTDKNTLSPKVLKELVVMKKNLEKKKDSDELKGSLKTSIEAITPLLADEKPINKAIAEKLKNITQVISRTETDLGKLSEDVGKELKEINEEVKKNEEIDMQTSIENNSKSYYEDLMSNVDKIQQAYADNPEQAKTTIRDYMVSVSEAIKTAKKDTDTYLSANRFTSKKHREKAQESLRSAISSVHDFMIDGERIREKPASPKKTQSPFSEDEYRIFKAVKDYGLGA